MKYGAGGGAASEGRVELVASGLLGKSICICLYVHTPADASGTSAFFSLPCCVFIWLRWVVQDLSRWRLDSLVRAQLWA